MSVTVHDLLPSLKNSLNKIGFFFGAGTSAESGYPLMPELTRIVVDGLKADERESLQEVLAAVDKKYEATTGIPNIEDLSDLTIAHALNTNEFRFKKLEEKLRELLVECLISVKNPNLDHHVKFFSALKRHSFGMPTNVCIFTTNYDVLFEIAAAYAGVRLENGFSGAVAGHFDPQRFNETTGNKEGIKFLEYSGLTVKLFKLHGSLSWYIEGNSIIEQHPNAMQKDLKRVMVLPRRKKRVETLSRPYEQLFALAKQKIGSECSYILSCGFSFSDDHITDTIFSSSLNSRKCHLTTLSEHEPLGILQLRSLPNFKGFYSDWSWENSSKSERTTSLWRFSELSSAF